MRKLSHDGPKNFQKFEHNQVQSLKYKPAMNEIAVKLRAAVAHFQSIPPPYLGFQPGARPAMVCCESEFSR